MDESDDSSAEGELIDEQEPPNGSFSSVIKKVRTYIGVSRAKRILRRYFVMNAFDGAMTSLGIVIGAYISHITDPRSVVGIIAVGAMAMAISGFAGTYMTESAERLSSLNDLEDAMLSNLEHTVHGRASRFVSLLAAFVDGTAPFIASIPSIAPFALTIFGILPLQLAFMASVAVALAVLFALGIFLGKISESNLIYSGMKMVVAGLIVALIALLLNGGLEN